MTLKDIAIFKHFMAEKDLRKPFIKVYRQSHDFAKLPVQVEDFFSNVEPLAVILSGMRVCAPNSAFGYDFWQDLHQMWKIYYGKMQHADCIINDGGALNRLEGYYKILRENWNDKDKPWRYEDMADALARLGLPPIDEDPPIEVEVKQEQPATTAEVTETAEAPEVVDEEEVQNSDPLADFDFFEPKDRQWTKLNRGDASINFRSGSFKITFNKYDSEDAASRQIACAKISKSKSTGDICLVFAKEGMLPDAIRVLYSTGGRTGKNLSINSKDICTKLRTLLNLKQDYTIIHMEPLPTTPDYLIFKLSI